MDPLELRLKNYSSKSQGDTALPYSLNRLDDCYKAGAEKIGSWQSISLTTAPVFSA